MIEIRQRRSFMVSPKRGETYQAMPEFNILFPCFQGPNVS